MTDEQDGLDDEVCDLGHDDCSICDEARHRAAHAAPRPPYQWRDSERALMEARREGWDAARAWTDPNHQHCGPLCEWSMRERDRRYPLPGGHAVTKKQKVSRIKEPQTLFDVDVCAPDFFRVSVMRANSGPSEFVRRATAFVQTMASLDRAVLLRIDGDGYLALSSVEDASNA